MTKFGVLNNGRRVFTNPAPSDFTAALRGGMPPSYANSAAFVAAKGSPAAEGETFFDTTYRVYASYRRGTWILNNLITNKIFTLGPGKDFANFADLNTYLERSFFDEAGTVIIDVDPGAYNENFEMYNILGRLIIRGDQRTLSGYGFCHGAAPKLRTNSGDGTITLSNVGNTITVTRSLANPNFAQLANGDALLLLDKTGIAGIYSVDSAAANSIVLTTTAPAVDGLGAGFCLIPNRVITSIANKSSGNLVIQGFYCNVFYNGNPLIQPFPNQLAGTLEIDNCFLYSGQIYANSGIVKIGSAYTESGVPAGSGAVTAYATEIVVFEQGFLQAQGYTALNAKTGSFATAAKSQDGGELKIFNSSFVGCNNSPFKLSNGSKLYASGIYLLGNNSHAIFATYGAKCYIQNSTIEYVGTPSYIGISANYGSEIAILSMLIKNCDIGLYAVNGGKISSAFTSFVGNNFDYSPASGILGNNGGLVSVA